MIRPRILVLDHGGNRARSVCSAFVLGARAVGWQAHVRSWRTDDPERSLRLIIGEIDDWDGMAHWGWRFGLSDAHQMFTDLGKPAIFAPAPAPSRPAISLSRGTCTGRAAR